MTLPTDAPDPADAADAADLTGRKVVVCRAAHQAGPLLAAVEAAGGEAVHVPLIEVVPPADGGEALRAALAGADATTWVAVTSANGIDAIANASPVRTSGSGPTFSGVIASGSLRPVWSTAVVGRATAARAEERALPVDFESPEPTGAGLGRTLPAEPGERVVAAVAELAGPDLVDQLNERGIEVQVVVAYRTVVPDIDPADVDRIRAADVVLVTAPSVIRRLLDLTDASHLPRLVAIGPTTERAVADAGLAVAATADAPSVVGLIRAAMRSLAP